MGKRSAPEPSTGEETSAAEVLGRTEEEAALLAVIFRKQDQVRIKPDILPAVSVLAFVSLLGMGIGWVWSRLAPAQQLVVLAGNQRYPLTDESYHQFDDLAIFCLLNLGVGILVGTVLWLMRERRGPVILIGAIVGALISGWLARQTGLSFANGLYSITGTPAVNSIVTQAPSLDSGLVSLMLQPFGVALAYGIGSSWNGRTDLGRRLG